ncbi:MAG TPA: DUF2490 domain-containing protein [Blastocatellia bacterium]|nr:DUF2490 domain-containing protein [Blastocatellia bacterium]
MLKLIVFSFIAAVTFTSCNQLFAQTKKAPAPKSDEQEWDDLQIFVPVEKQVDLVLYGTLRFGRDVTHFVDERVGAGLQFKVGKHFTFTPGYLYIGMQPVAGKFAHENRLWLDARGFFTYKGFIVQDRNMIERRIFTAQPDTWRYRNRLRVEHWILKSHPKFTLLSSDEVFYDTAVKRWVRNRFQVGFGNQFGKHVVGEIYYMKQNDAVSHPGYLNIIGTTVRVRL